MDTLRRLLSQYRIAAIAMVTLLTLGIVGAVVLTTTSAGCGPANKLGLKTAQCINGGPVANVGHPSPTPSTGLPPAPSPTTVPYNPPATSYPPYNPGASSYPPYNPGASAGNPYPLPSSGSFPPMAYPISGSFVPYVSLSCRLPVYAGGPGSGGFIVFPGVSFVADPRSAVMAPSPSPTSASPTPAPPQYGPGYPAGFYGLTYDAPYSKWLPAPWAWVSPDGKSYGYPLNGDIYVENVANGTALELGQGHGYSMLDAENSGVYVTSPNQPGLWFLASSGTVKQITASGFWQAARGGSAYGTATSQVPPGASNTILKLDLASGATGPFFATAGAQSTVTGFDGQGHPVIQVDYFGGPSYPGGRALFIATGPNTSYPIAAVSYGSYNPPPFPSGTPIADSHGLWFSVGNGMVLYANDAWYWMANIGGQLAGQCL